jgi:hypothetical protein
MAVLPTVLVAAFVMGCGVFGGADGQEPVSLAGWEVAVVAEDTLELTIPSCLGQPRLTGLAQDDEAVTVEVITTVVDEGPACADVLRVELDEPLGDRQVVDATSGEAMRIRVRY